MRAKSEAGRRAAALCLIACSSSLCFAQTVRVVAVTGEQAPGMDEGVSFLTISSSGIGSVPSVPDGLFLALLTGPGINSENEHSVWRGDGIASLVLQAGAEAPGTGGLRFSYFWPIGAGGPERYAFRANLSDDNRGIWANRSGALEYVVRQGDQAPDQPEGTTVNALGYPKLGAEISAFSGRLRQPSGQQIDTIFLDRSGVLESALIEGDLAPDTQRPIVAFDTLALGPSGQSVVGIQLDRYAHGLWTNRSGSFRLLALQGNPAPGWDQVNFGDVFSRADVNAAGSCAFTAKMDIGGVHPSGSFTDRSGALEAIAVWMDQAPGTPEGTQFGVSQGDLLLNDHGHVVFGASLTGDGTNSNNNFGLWAEGPDGELDLLVRSGDRLPHAPDDTWIRARPRRLKFNNRHDVVLHAQLAGSNVNYTNDDAVLAFAGLGEAELLLREGQVLDLGNGDFRTVFDFDLESELTDDGRVYLLAEFTDGERAVLELTVPDAGACAVDLNGDGSVDSRDFIAFLSAWAAGDPLADWDDNGLIDTRDFLAYLGEWSAGCP